MGWIIAGRFQMPRPAVLADVLGAALVLYAPTLLLGTNIDEGRALLLGSLIAGGLLGASTWLRSTALFGVGAVGLHA